MWAIKKIYNCISKYNGVRYWMVLMLVFKNGKKVTKFLKKEDFFQEILRKSSILSCLIPLLFVLKLMTGLGIKEDVRKSLKKKRSKNGQKMAKLHCKNVFYYFFTKNVFTVEFYDL